MGAVPAAVGCVSNSGIVVDPGDISDLCPRTDAIHPVHLYSHIGSNHPSVFMGRPTHNNTCITAHTPMN